MTNWLNFGLLHSHFPGAIAVMLEKHGIACDLMQGFMQERPTHCDVQPHRRCGSPQKAKVQRFVACGVIPLRGILLRMRDVKDTQRALVRISYDGRVFKTFRGPKAEERFENEVRVLRHLEERGCAFVPRLLEADSENLRIVTTNCGSRVEHLDDARVPELFAELLPYGVRHDDADKRNVTYRQSDGRFCLIDFEFATILPEPEKKPDGTAT